MNIEYIDQLIKKMNEASLTEISYKDNEIDIKLKKDTPKIIESVPKTSETKVVQEETQPSQPVEASKVIKAPMVGTFYKAPSPESEQFVKVGDTVENHTVVCILEAMKLFNEIQAETTGEIVEILVEDGEMVEYDQPLFKLK